LISDFLGEEASSLGTRSDAKNTKKTGGLLSTPRNIMAKLSDLPVELHHIILGEVLSGLKPWCSRKPLKFVCRLWRDIVSDNCLKPKHRSDCFEPWGLVYEGQRSGVRWPIDGEGWKLVYRAHVGGERAYDIGICIVATDPEKADFLTPPSINRYLMECSFNIEFPLRNIGRKGNSKEKRVGLYSDGYTVKLPGV
jgi:hypothetical protein